MGGTFLVKDNQPYFKPEEGIEVEIKTENNNGLEIIVDSNPGELKPNKYYNFGTVCNFLKINKLLSYSKTHVETYAGEFTIGEGGQVRFPAVVRWVGGYPYFSEVGYTYQFEIKNGIGQYIKVQ